jgi:putative N6-adenine-specific DNA methylase
LKHASPEQAHPTHYATCPRGLEALLVDELEAAGATHCKAGHAAVLFRADGAAEMRANLHSRIATRILRKIGFTRYRNEDDIYRAALKLPWTELFDTGKTIAVKVAAQDAPLKSLNFITLRIKDAVCDAHRAVGGLRPNVDARAPQVPIFTHLTRDAATFYLDTSGEPLFRRGFRREAGMAPIKENLAAGLLMLSGWRPGEPLLDPMCGAGTILLEAAEMSLNLAPGRGRAFAFEHFTGFDAESWRGIKRAVEEARIAPHPLPIYGADRSQLMLESTRANLAAAGLDGCVTLKLSDALELNAPSEHGVIVTNPPYGERLSDRETLAEWYPLLGDWLKKNFSGWRACILSADPELPRRIHLHAARRHVLFNGPLEARLLEYRMIEGSLRKPRGATPQASEPAG